MSSRNYLSPEELKPRKDAHSRRTLIESPPRHRVADDRVSVNHHREILLADNQRLAATCVALKQELTVALQDHRHLSVVAEKVKAERGGEVRELFEKAVKREGEVRLIDEMSADLVQVRGDVKNLIVENKEFGEKLEKVKVEAVKERVKVRELAEIKAGIEAMKKEILRGRAAVEYEKKVYAANMEQRETMEKSRISMAREIEKLQADLANANKKAMAAAAAAATNTPGTVYGAGYGNHDMGYGGTAFPGPYVGHQGGVDPQHGSAPIPLGPYDMQHHMVNPYYAVGTGPHGPYDMHHPNAH